MTGVPRVSPGVAWDEWGFETPFDPTGRSEAEALLEGPLLSERLESPFSEAEGGLTAADIFRPEAFSGAWTESEDHEAAPVTFEGEGFPTGIVLQPASGATGRDEEHWDPHATGLPLLATGPATHALRVSRSFTVGELVRSGGRAASVARISPALVRVLQAIRDRAGRPIRITSGYRSWARNKDVYRARNKKPTLSRHCSGQAVDIKIAGMTGTQIAQLAIDAAGLDLAIGVGATFAHIDVRGSWTLWTYMSGSAAATALRTVRAYRESRGRGPTPVRPAAPPTAPTPMPPPAPAPVIGPPGSGTAIGRLVVERHPLLRGHAGTPPDLVMRWNTISQPGEVDVVVHLHGFSGQRARMSLRMDKEPNSGLDFADPAGSGARGRTRPTLALLPRGHFYGGRSGNGYSFPALVRPGALLDLVNDGLARFSAHTGITARLGRLILTAHSGGGAPLATILANSDPGPDEIHVFDGLYGSGDAIVRWAARRIAREVASPSAIPPALRILYRPGSAAAPGTQPHSEAVARALCPLLQAPGAGRLAPYFRVDRTTVGHNDIPRRFGWALLANSAAELPGVTRRECGPRRGGETGEFEMETTGWETSPNEREESERERAGMYEGEGMETGLGSAAANGYEAQGYEAQGYQGPDTNGRQTESFLAETFEPESLDWEEAQRLADTLAVPMSTESGETGPFGAERYEPEGLDWTEAEGLAEQAYESGYESGVGEAETIGGEGSEGEELDLEEAFDAGEAGLQSSEEARTDQYEEVEAPYSEGPYSEGPYSEGPYAPEAEAAGPATEALENLLEAEAGAGTSLTDRLKGIAAFALGPPLRRGSKGVGVEALQRALAALGHSLGVDGDFGPRTERAVRAFQSQAGIEANGVVGPETKTAIAAALARLGQAPAPIPPSPTPTPVASGLCDAIARTAEQEFRRWHPASGNLRETDAAATPILQQYYREGAGTDVPAQDLQSTTWQASHPWSAVFVSWVMRTAGAGTSFRYSPAHQSYIRAARRNRLDGNTASPFWAFRPTEVAPQVGDLVCASRANSGATYDNIGDAQGRPTHCDIVTEIRPRSLRVIGGNVRQNVDAKTIRTLPDGRLALDGDQARFFAVVRCRGNVGGSGGSTTPTPPQAPPTPAGTRLTPAQFVATFGPHAGASEAATTVPALVTLGQAALESGWGAHAPRFNFFGIKARASDPEPTRQLLRTREVLSRPDVTSFPEVISVTPRADGRYDYVVRDWFRAYPDAAAAFRAHGEFLQRNKRYAPAFTVRADPYAFATEVARAGYATDPSYARVLHGVMRSLENAGR